MKDGDKYLDPKTNPFILTEPSGSGDRPFDDRFPFGPPGKASGGLSELLEREFLGGGIVEVGGIKLVRLLGAWATEDGRQIDALPAQDVERIKKAIIEKGEV